MATSITRAARFCSYPPPQKVRQERNAHDRRCYQRRCSTAGAASPVLLPRRNMKLHASLPVPTLLPSATHNLSYHRMRESVEPLHDYHYRLFTPTRQMPAAGWPLLIFLHGAGQCRTDGRRSRRALHHEEGGPATFKDEIAEVGEFVIAMPQTFCSSNWWRVDAVAALAR
eukprot:3816885-Prymnesium_polylepis.1